jgi:hypothetical protein
LNTSLHNVKISSERRLYGKKAWLNTSSGRTHLYLMRVGGASSGIPIREIVRHEHELKYQSKCCKKKLKDLDFSFRNKWDNLQTNLTKRTIHIWKTSLLLFWDFPALDRVIFIWYVNALFACSILYDLRQIIACRLGFICVPELPNRWIGKCSSLLRKRAIYTWRGRVKNLCSQK